MEPIISLLTSIIRAYSFLMFIWVIISWIPELRNSSFNRFLDRIIEPFLKPIRKIIPPINGIDISPIIGFFVLNLITEAFLLIS